MPNLNEPFRDNEVDQLVFDTPVDDSDPDLPPPPDGGHTGHEDDEDIILVDLLGATADLFDFVPNGNSGIDSAAEIGDEQFTFNFEALDFDLSAGLDGWDNTKSVKWDADLGIYDGVDGVFDSFAGEAAEAVDDVWIDGNLITAEEKFPAIDLGQYEMLIA